MIAYKFLAPGAVGPFTRYRWPTPSAAGPGAWVEAPHRAVEHGVHACVERDLAFWLDEELWVAELGDPVAAGHRQVVASRGRLLDRVTRWDGDAARELAGACAWRARDRFVGAMRGEAREDEAERLAAARDLGELRHAAQALRGGRGVAAAASSYLRDALEALASGDAPLSIYVSARAAVAASGGDEATFAREREEQGWLLARCLGIAASDGGRT